MSTAVAERFNFKVILTRVLSSPILLNISISDCISIVIENAQIGIANAKCTRRKHVLFAKRPIAMSGHKIELNLHT